MLSGFHIKKEKGFTLIETLIALCLFAFVSSICYIVITSGSASLNTIASSHKIQNDARLSADLITREVRNAQDVELLDAAPQNLETGWRYIYLDGNSVVFINENAAVKTRIGNSVESLSFELLQNDNNSNMLRFVVKTGKGGKLYELITEVMLNNIKGRTSISEKPVIRYRLPQ